MRKKTIEIVGGLAVLLIACLITPAAAWPTGYDYDGFSFDTQESGTFKGTVYCDDGSRHGLGFTPYTVAYSSIPTGTVKWAYLITGVWGGTESYTGWANITVTNTSGTYGLCNEVLNISPGAMSSNTSCSGNGKWMIVNDVTGYVDSSTFSATANTAGSIDGRVYSIVLIAAVEDSSKNATAYWLNGGNVNLRYDAGSGEANYELTDMDTPSYSSALAKLYAMQYVGTSGERDYLYFNAPYAFDSPRYLNNISWDRTKYAKYQLGDYDVADCSEGSYFDLDIFTASSDSTPLADLVNLVDDNEVLFWRGHDDDNDGEIDASWVGGGTEGEAYVSPIVALLVLDDIWRTYDFSDETPGTAGTCLKAYDNNTFVNSAANRGVRDLVNNEFGSYTEIEADDSDYKVTTSTVIGTSAAQRFRFCCINETDAASLKVTWNGYGYDSADGATLYLWNDCTGQYEQIDTDSSTSGEITLSGTKTSSISCYIVDGCVNVLVVQNGETYSIPMPPSSSDSTLATDYIVLEVVPNVT